MKIINTPAFILDKEQIRKNLLPYKELQKKADFKLLYSLKSLSLMEALSEVSHYADGFSVSSLFEAKLANKVKKEEQSIHFVSPAIKEADFESLSKLCSSVSFNSIGQFARLCPKSPGSIEIGLRINPGLSFVKDQRYDPCRKHSKLGETIESISKLSEEDLKKISGFHFHNNCDSDNFLDLKETFLEVERKMGKLLENIKWFNLGGGYSLKGSENSENLLELIGYLNEKYDFDVILEPGSGVVNDAGSIVSSVTDIFSRDGENIAILDTTINHMPEVFEYQYRPDILEDREDGSYKYILAGSSCLAGDLFGSYSFEKPLEIDSKITFKNMGSYSLVKSNMFNGINLPTIYSLDKDNLAKIKSFDFSHYLNQN